MPVPWILWVYDSHTVDGRNPAPVYPIISKVLYIPRGAGVLPSTLCLNNKFLHQSGLVVTFFFVCPELGSSSLQHTKAGNSSWVMDGHGSIARSAYANCGEIS